MQIDDFLKKFPDEWRICYNIPQLEQELGKAPTERLIKRLDECLSNSRDWDSDFRKVQFHNERKDNLLSQIDQELGESEAKKRLMRLKTWLERLEDEKLEKELIESNLKNDLFFGFLIMFKFRNEGMWFKEAIATRKDSQKQVKFYKQLQMLARKVPKADEVPWRGEWQGRFQKLVDEWIQRTGMAIEEIHKVRARNLDKVKRYCKAFAGKSGQEIPKINKDISAYLKNRLAVKLRGGREPQINLDNVVSAHQKRAAELIIEGAMILDTKLEGWNRLRTA